MEKSLQVEYLISEAREMAAKRNLSEVEDDILFLALYSETHFDIPGKILYDNNISIQDYRTELNKHYTKFLTPDDEDYALPELSDEVVATFNRAEEFAIKSNSTVISPLHLILALLESNNEILSDFLSDKPKTKVISDIVCYIFTGDLPNCYGLTCTKQSKKLEIPKVVTDNCIDYTLEAEKGNIDPVIGRTKEINMIIQTLARRTKNNVLLLGESGTGKTSIIKGLALRIANGDIPALADKRIFSLQYGKLMTDTKYRGDLEGKVQKIMDAFLALPNAILFIDEIHMLLGGSSSEDKTNVASMIKPMITDRKLQIIGATTFKESKKLEADQAFLRRFNSITIEEPNDKDTFDILSNLKYKYEEFHNVEIPNEVVKETIRLTNRYITLRHQPDKSIDVLDEAAAKAKLANTVISINKVSQLESEITSLKSAIAVATSFDELIKLYSTLELKEDELTLALEEKEHPQDVSNNKYTLTIDDVAKIIEDRTKIPVAKLMASDKQKILTLEEDIMKQVIGQNQAVKSVANAIKRNSAGINNPNKPIASFLFAGKSGTGKTELAKVLADLRFGSRESIVRIDCSEYSEEHAVSKLIGSNPGYVGYSEGGMLTEAIKNKPYTIVLFDEIEKAHPKFTEILLQVLDDGRLTDNTGTTINFKNTIIIMTTNMGSGLLDKTNSVGFGSNDAVAKEENEYEKLKEITMGSIKKRLRPEVINRIDEIIVFKSLSKTDLRDITRLLGIQLDKRLESLNITAKCSDAALDFIADNGGYDSQYGARPLAKAIIKHIEEPLSLMILEDKVDRGDNIFIDCIDDELVFYKQINEELILITKESFCC